VEVGGKVSFNKEARQTYLRFAMSGEAQWQGNFRDLGASVLRMATLADGGRITDELVEQEIKRLQKLWGNRNEPQATELSGLLSSEQLAKLDLFDRLQLQSVLTVCKQCKSLSEAGRKLFAVSRSQRGSTNDSDRLRKYLAKFGMEWANL